MACEISIPIRDITKQVLEQLKKHNLGFVREQDGVARNLTLRHGVILDDAVATDIYHALKPMLNEQSIRNITIEGDELAFVSQNGMKVTIPRSSLASFLANADTALATDAEVQRAIDKINSNNATDEELQSAINLINNKFKGLAVEKFLASQMLEGYRLKSIMSDGQVHYTDLSRLREGLATTKRVDDLEASIQNLPAEKFVVEQRITGKQLVTRLNDGTVFYSTVPSGATIVSQQLQGNTLVTTLSEGDPIRTDLSGLTGNPVQAQRLEGNLLKTELKDGTVFTTDLSKFSDVKVVRQEIIGTSLVTTMSDGVQHTLDINNLINTDLGVQSAVIEGDPKELVITLENGDKKRIPLQGLGNATDKHVVAIEPTGDGGLTLMMSNGDRVRGRLGDLVITDMRADNPNFYDDANAESIYLSFEGQTDKYVASLRAILKRYVPYRIYDNELVRLSYLMTRAFQASANNWSQYVKFTGTRYIPISGARYIVFEARDVVYWDKNTRTILNKNQAPKQFVEFLVKVKRVSTGQYIATLDRTTGAIPLFQSEPSDVPFVMLGIDQTATQQALESYGYSYRAVTTIANPVNIIDPDKRYPDSDYAIELYAYIKDNPVSNYDNSAYGEAMDIALAGYYPLIVGENLNSKDGLVTNANPVPPTVAGIYGWNNEPQANRRATFPHGVRTMSLNLRLATEVHGTTPETAKKILTIKLGDPAVAILAEGVGWLSNSGFAEPPSQYVYTPQIDGMPFVGAEGTTPSPIEIWNHI